MKENFFIRITPENSVQGIEKTEDTKMLDFLYSAIDCDCIEIVRFGKVRNGERQVAIVDESGMLKGSKLNMIATYLLKRPIVGTVLFAIESECDLRGYNPIECACARYAIDDVLTQSKMFDRKDSE